MESRKACLIFPQSIKTSVDSVRASAPFIMSVKLKMSLFIILTSIFTEKKIKQWTLLIVHKSSSQKVIPAYSHQKFLYFPPNNMWLEGRVRDAHFYFFFAHPLIVINIWKADLVHISNKIYFLTIISFILNKYSSF